MPSKITDPALSAAAEQVRELFAYATAEVNKLFPQDLADFRHAHVDAFVRAAVGLAAAGEAAVEPASEPETTATDEPEEPEVSEGSLTLPADMIDSCLLEYEYVLVERYIAMVGGGLAEFVREHPWSSGSWTEAWHEQVRANVAEAEKVVRYLRGQGSTVQSYDPDLLGELSPHERYEASVGIFMLLRRAV